MGKRLLISLSINRPVSSDTQGSLSYFISALPIYSPLFILVFPDILVFEYNTEKER